MHLNNVIVVVMKVNKSWTNLQLPWESVNKKTKHNLSNASVVLKSSGQIIKSTLRRQYAALYKKLHKKRYFFHIL